MSRYHAQTKRELRQDQIFRWCQHNTAIPAEDIALKVCERLLRHWTDTTIQMQSKVSLHIADESLPCFC